MSNTIDPSLIVRRYRKDSSSFEIPIPKKTRVVRDGGAPSGGWPSALANTAVAGIKRIPDVVVGTAEGVGDYGNQVETGAQEFVPSANIWPDKFSSEGSPTDGARGLGQTIGHEGMTYLDKAVRLGPRMLMGAGWGAAMPADTLGERIQNAAIGGGAPLLGVIPKAIRNQVVEVSDWIANKGYHPFRDPEPRSLREVNEYLSPGGGDYAERRRLADRDIQTNPTDRGAALETEQKYRRYVEGPAFDRAAMRPESSVPFDIDPNFSTQLRARMNKWGPADTTVKNDFEGIIQEYNLEAGGSDWNTIRNAEREINILLGKVSTATDGAMVKELKGMLNNAVQNATVMKPILGPGGATTGRMVASRRGVPPDPYRNPPVPEQSAIDTSQAMLDLTNTNPLFRKLRDPSQSSDAISHIFAAQEGKAEKVINFFKMHNPRVYEELRVGVKGHISELVGDTTAQTAQTSGQGATEVLSMLRDPNKEHVLSLILTPEEMRYLVNGLRPRMEALGAETAKSGLGVKPYLRLGAGNEGNPIRAIVSPRGANIDPNEMGSDFPLRRPLTEAERTFGETLSKLLRPAATTARLGTGEE